MLRIIDGDTYEVRARLPFFTERRVQIRLRDVSAPEKSTPDGKKSKAWVEGVIPPGAEVGIRTELVATTGDETMTFARYVADVTLPDGNDLGQVMIAAGVARAGAFEG